MFECMLMPADNKATLSYFGSAEAVKEEKNRATAQKTWVIHPCSTFSFFTADVQYSSSWISVSVVIDLVFVTDLILNFRTGLFQDTEAVLLDLKIIRNRYFKTWFFPDLLAVLPLDYCILILVAVGAVDSQSSIFAEIRMMRLIKVLRLLSLLRLLRISKLLRYVRQWEEVNGWDVGSIATVLKFLHMIVIIFLMCHWNACFQFMVASIMDFPKNSWVRLEGLVNKPMSYQYTKSMFRALCHMMTLNYGSKVIPKELTELWVVNMSLMVGTVMYMLVLAHMTALITNSRSSEVLYNNKMNEMKVYMRHYRLPNSLRDKIFNHVENRYRRKWFDEKAILMELSEPLRREVISYNCSSLISNMPLFKDVDPFFKWALLEVVDFELYEKEDLIIRRGAVGDCMFFIERGDVEVQMPTFSKILSDGEFFGETCLLNRKMKRTANVLALTPCRLYCLSVDNYNKVLARFPDMKAHIQAVAQERLQELSETKAKAKPTQPHRIVFRSVTGVLPKFR
ncbi:potassium/sodium hyperpolarization-activated cyclic nucleotide-gated channel 2-like isoform X2 [Hoplias malabaricus]|uniref:potassium/sodium hyperpolarization-activated cyclic nucleotide-gated channel 2-like isoform X2 n=1 Tax=Hoplias malabaricus TaxID=27720 RepID=UPI00346282F4